MKPDETRSLTSMHSPATHGTERLADVSPPVTLQSITREALAALPIRRYEGTVHVLASTSELESALHELSREQVIGFDTETRPSFQKGQSYLPTLVQMASSRAVYLFQPKRIDVTDSLRSILESPHIVKAGVAVADDLRKLKDVFLFTERSVVDLGDVAKRHNVGQSGVRNLVGLFLGWRVTKGTRTSNWAREQLSSSQITYAATDAWACRELYLQFQRKGWLPPSAQPQ